MRILEGDEYSLAWYAMQICKNWALQSTCHRSRCGSVIINMGNPEWNVLGVGFNSMPYNCQGPCIKDTLPSTFKSDRTCCVHAEQRAIMDALKYYPEEIVDSTLFFIRLDDEGNMLKAGKPYCTICSKMALDIGIKEFVLWHEDGITAYDTLEYNNLSFQYK